MALLDGTEEKYDVPLTGTQMNDAIVQAHLSKDAITKIDGLEASAEALDRTVYQKIIYIINKT